MHGMAAQESFDAQRMRPVHFQTVGNDAQHLLYRSRIFALSPRQEEVEVITTGVRTLLADFSAVSLLQMYDSHHSSLTQNSGSSSTPSRGERDMLYLRSGMRWIMMRC